MAPPPCADRFELIPIPANSHKTITVISGTSNSTQPQNGAFVTSVSLHLALPTTSEGGACVGVDGLAEGRQIVSADLGHGPHRERHEIGRVGTAAVRHRREVRRIGLDQDPVPRGSP